MIARYEHNIIAFQYIGHDTNELDKIILNYHIQEGKYLDSLELIDKMVTPIQNPQEN